MVMSSELRIKKLRASGGYVMARVTDEQQTKGNLGGPDLFLAPIGRLEEDKISKYFCNTCEKEFEGPPKIEFENPNEEVAENLILVERGQYICGSCNAPIAEYREFRKSDEGGDIGNAKPLEPQAEAVQQPQAPQPAEEARPEAVQQPQEATQPEPATSVSSIEGRSIYDENANKVGTAKHVGIDSAQSMVLIITRNDGTEGSIPWNSIKKVGEIILLGRPGEEAQPGKCAECGFANKEGSKFCEECGASLQ